MAPDATPEEKLLHAMDEPSRTRARADERFMSRLPFSAALIGWLAKLQERRGGAKPALTLRMVNRGLAAACGVLTIVWLVDFLSARSEFQRRLGTVERTQLTAPVKAKDTSLPPVKLQEVLEATRERNIFTFLPHKLEAAPPATARETDQAVKELKLVGIIWSTRPQAMIEQTTEGTTYLVAAGEPIGPFAVKKILADKVILSQENQEWELQ